MASTKLEREKAVKRSLANSALEGLKPDPEFIALLDRYIAGEITLDQAIEHTKAQHKQKMTGTNALAGYTEQLRIVVEGERDPSYKSRPASDGGTYYLLPDDEHLLQGFEQGRDCKDDPII